jgi:UDP-N-acetylglucosamine--N-acetylmuramyl-(pentapeptide) pyrophosphoryl-undecaprenol N-acetylglucosamine transferase
MEQVSVPVVISTITAGKFRRYAHLTWWQHIAHLSIVWSNITDLVKIIIGFFQSLVLIIRFWPDVVFAKGGYVCLPLGIAAWLLRRPLVIHDSDTRPGLTNRVLARFATKIATGSPLENYPYDKKKSSYVGVPIDTAFKPVNQTTQDEYKKSLGVDAGNILIVAMGGGLGSLTINDAMSMVAHQLRDKDVVVYNITGKKYFERAKERSEELSNYIPVSFVYENMHQVLGAADIVVSRASATFLQELAGLKKVVIAVPARQLGDQQMNARVFEAAGAVITLSDKDIENPNVLTETIDDLLANKQKREHLAHNLHSFARPQAAADTAKLIVSANRGK